MIQLRIVGFRSKLVHTLIMTPDVPRTFKVSGSKVKVSYSVT